VAVAIFTTGRVVADSTVLIDGRKIQGFKRGVGEKVLQLYYFLSLQ